MTNNVRSKYVCYHGHVHDGNRPEDGTVCPDIRCPQCENVRSQLRTMRKKEREAMEKAKHGITPEEEATAYPKEDA